VEPRDVDAVNVLHGGDGGGGRLPGRRWCYKGCAKKAIKCQGRKGERIECPAGDPWFVSRESTTERVDDKFPVGFSPGRLPD
jgi:hypothetical protein